VPPRVRPGSRTAGTRRSTQASYTRRRGPAPPTAMSFPGCSLSLETSSPTPACGQPGVTHHALKRRGEHNLRQAFQVWANSTDPRPADSPQRSPSRPSFIEPPSAEMHSDFPHMLGVEPKQLLVRAPTSRSHHPVRRCSRPATQSTSRSACASRSSFGWRPAICALRSANAHFDFSELRGRFDQQRGSTRREHTQLLRNQGVMRICTQQVISQIRTRSRLSGCPAIHATRLSAFERRLDRLVAGGGRGYPRPQCPAMSAAWCSKASTSTRPAAI